MVLSLVLRVFIDITMRMPPSMQMGMECATVLLRSVEIVQNKLAVDQKVNARTDKPKARGQFGRVFFLVMKTKRQTRTARPNKMIIPFVAYNATTGINRPTRLNAREIGDILVWICFKFEINFIFFSVARRKSFVGKIR